MPPPAAKEIEAKYRVLTRATAERLASAAELSAGFPASKAATIACLDVYYDTAAYDLARRGLALRVRQSGDGLTVSAKTLTTRRKSAVHHRVEVEDQVSPENAKPPYLNQCCADLREIVDEHNPRGKKLRPILALHQTRQKRMVESEDNDGSSPLAESSLDDILVLSGHPPEGETSEIELPAAIAEFRELEIELLPDADYQRLRFLARRLSKRRGLQKSRISKLEAGLSALANGSGATAHPNIQPAMHMAEACRLIWRRQAMQLVLLEHGVRAGNDPEYVHDMRVAIRRARTAYELFGHYFRRRKVDPFFKTMRRLAKLLGRVRDMDVALASLKTFHKQVPRSHKANIGKLEDVVHQRQKTARAELIKWLDSRKHAAFIADFMEFTNTPGKGVRKSVALAQPPEPIQVRHCMPGVIADRYDRVRAYEPLFESDLNATVEQMHALRIECKYLRYVLEFSRHLLGDEGDTLIRQLKMMQDHLGDLNDCAVEYRYLQKWKGSGLEDSVVHHRMQYLTTKEARLRDEFPGKFWAFITQENRCLLGAAIANI